MKSEIFKLRLTPKQRALLRTNAELAGLSQSEYVRRLIEGKRITSAGQKKQVDRLLYELSKIGTNINQIAHALNGHFYSYPADAEEMKSLQKDLQDAIRTIIALWQ